MTQLPPVGAPGSEERVQALHSRALWVVALLALTYAVEGGVETGIASCSLTSMQTDVNTTLTAITTAYTMSEVGKLAGAMVSLLITDNRWQGRAICAGVLFCSAGAVVVGLAEAVWLIAVGFFVVGFGCGFMAVLAPAVVNYFVPFEKHRQAAYLAAVYAGFAIGIAIGFVACGATVDMSWRWNYFVAAMLLLPAAAALFAVDRLALAAKAALFGELPCAAAAAVVGCLAVATSPPPPTLSAYADQEEAAAARDVDAAEAQGESPASTTAVVAFEERRAVSHPPETSLSMCAALMCIARIAALDFTFLAQTFNFFWIAAYVTLLPAFVERGLGQSKDTASYVLAATVPAVATGLLFGGFFVKHMRFRLHGQLLFVAVTSALTFPVTFVFYAQMFWVFVSLLVLGMFVAYSAASPGVTLLPLAIDASAIPALRHPAEGDDGATRTEMGSAGIDDSTFPVGGSEATPDPRREQLVRYANVIANLFLRAGGSIPGPIVLAALVDYSDTHRASLSRASAYVIVGAAGTSISAIVGLVAWAVAPRAPTHARVVPTATHEMEGSASQY